MARLTVVIVVLCVMVEQGWAAESPIAKFTETGQLAKGLKVLDRAVKANPQDAKMRFGYGVVSFLRALERLAQAQFEHGFLTAFMSATPNAQASDLINKKPKEISYERSRAICKQFLSDLQRTEQILAKVDTSQVKLVIHPGRIRLDFDGDGKASDAETFWRIFAAAVPVQEAKARQFQITFDGGDVHWLRGYCHFLMALSEFSLAYDWKDSFERTAHLLYPKVKTPHAYLQNERIEVPKDGFNLSNPMWMLDAIALIHTLNAPLKDPQRMQRALGHFEAMIAQSRASWKRILAEKDDDHEWLPNPKQTGVIPNVRIRKEMIDGWHEFLSEMEAIFKGKTLVPFWRGTRLKVTQEGSISFINPTVGINLRKVFTRPRRFDLVLWVQGTAATPYLERGKITDPKVWQRLMRVFRGEFFGFAFWFN